MGKDGVLLRGETVLEPTRNAFRILHGDNPFNRWVCMGITLRRNVLTSFAHRKIPYIFVRWLQSHNAALEGMTSGLSADQPR